ncbi:hypothetical protein ACDV02_001957 [Neisseria gonorrhoeae]
MRAGFIFGSLYRFDRLKKRFSLMLKGGLYRVPGGVSTKDKPPGLIRAAVENHLPLDLFEI